MKKLGLIAARLLCALLAVLCVLPAAAAAAEAEVRSGSLKIVFVHNSFPYEGEPFVGAKFSIYRAAEVLEDGTTVLAGNFLNCGVRVGSNLTIDEWRTVTTTLVSVVNRDQIKPDRFGFTDFTGTLLFTDLVPGVYLVVGDIYNEEIRRNIYIPQPFLVVIPGSDEHHQPTVYDVEAEPKYDFYYIPPDTVNRRVIKIWDDDFNRDGIRPDHVTAQLWCDGILFDEVELSDANNWGHTWTNLEAEHNWIVSEKYLPDGYTVLIDRMGLTFTIINSHTPEEPDDPEEPPDEIKEYELPQTGQLWWPVPVLICGGAVIFVLGLILLFSKRSENND